MSILTDPLTKSLGDPSKLYIKSLPFPTKASKTIIWVPTKLNKYIAKSRNDA